MGIAPLKLDTQSSTSVLFGIIFTEINDARILYRTVDIFYTKFARQLRYFTAPSMGIAPLKLNTKPSRNVLCHIFY